MKKFGVILFLLSLFWVAGCKSEPERAYTSPVLAEEWSVKMTVSGGIMGLLQSIEVQSDGAYAAADQRVGKIVKGEVAADDLATLEQLLSTLKFSAPENPPICADCFVFDIEIESGGRKMLIHADDITANDSGIGELVQFLRERLESALK